MSVFRTALCLLVAATVLQACAPSFGRLHGERRDVALSWSRYSEPLQGLAIYDGFKMGYELYIGIPSDDDQCNGFVRMETNKWALACPDGTVVQGTLSARGGDRLTGTGRDSSGRAARLAVLGLRD